MGVSGYCEEARGVALSRRPIIIEQRMKFSLLIDGFRK
jgi:hypothetical protein